MSIESLFDSTEKSLFRVLNGHHNGNLLRRKYLEKDSRFKLKIYQAILTKIMQSVKKIRTKV